MRSIQQFGLDAGVRCIRENDRLFAGHGCQLSGTNLPLVAKGQTSGLIVFADVGATSGECQEYALP